MPHAFAQFAMASADEGKQVLAELEHKLSTEHIELGVMDMIYNYANGKKFLKEMKMTKKDAKKLEAVYNDAVNNPYHLYVGWYRWGDYLPEGGILNNLDIAFALRMGGGFKKLYTFIDHDDGAGFWDEHNKIEKLCCETEEQANAAVDMHQLLEYLKDPDAQNYDEMNILVQNSEYIEYIENLPQRLCFLLTEFDQHDDPEEASWPRCLLFHPPLPADASLEM